MRSAAVFMATVAVLGCGIESEDALRSRFTEHQAVFEELLAMFEADSHLVRVAPDFTRLRDDWSWPRENVGISDERWERYRRLFREADIESGIERHGDQILFYMSTIGLAVSGRSRGVAYTRERPLEISDDLDSRSGEGISYVPLHDEWYLFDWAQ